MKKSTRNIKNYSLLFLSVGISCLILCGAIVFVGGLYYQNPHLAFGELFHPEPLKNYIFSIIPNVK